MGFMRSSEDQDLFARGPKASNVKGKQNKEKTKFYPHKKKEKIQQSDEPSGSRKKNKGEKRIQRAHTVLENFILKDLA